MKISCNWLGQYIEDLPAPEKVSEILTQTGLEVEGTEKWSNISATTEKLIVGKVESVRPHSNADKLKIAEVTIDSNEDRKNIVCGAPNIEEGQNVIVALPGTIFYEQGREKLTIRKSKIRGEVSEGMICSEKELGLGSDHSGILVLKETYPPGTPIEKVYNIYRDTILEIGLTPNRGDGASHIGCARDIAAVLGCTLKYPDVSDFNESKSPAASYSVKIDPPELCPRYAGLSMTSVRVGESPEWLRNYLLSVGMKPINNVVDAASFVMLETGQPLHIFDRDLIEGNTIHVGLSEKNTEFKTLDEQVRKLSGEELMIKDEKKPVAMAGVMGGNNSCVSGKTNNIFIESACFEQGVIRKGNKKHLINSDAAFRYERGVDPNLSVYALKRVAALLQTLSGAEATSAIVDHYPEPVEPVEVFLSFEYLDRLTGQKIPHDKIISILKALDFEIEEKLSDGLRLKVPTYRTEVTRPADVAEEVLRIYSFDVIEFPGKMQTVMQPSGSPDRDDILNRISDFLCSNGFMEIMTNSLMDKAAIGQGEAERAVEVMNPLSRDLNVLRPSVLYTCLDAVLYNINRKNRDLKFFEAGRSFGYDDEGNYTENEGLHILTTGQLTANSWYQKADKADHFYIKAIIQNLLINSGAGIPEFRETDNKTVLPGQSIFINKTEVGYTGNLSPRLLKDRDIDQPVLYGFIDLDFLLKCVQQNKDIQYNPVNKYPFMRRDLSILLDREIPYEALKSEIEKSAGKWLTNVRIFDVYEGEKVQSGSKSYAVTMTFESHEQTLTDELVDEVINKIIHSVEKKLSATVRRS